MASPLPPPPATRYPCDCLTGALHHHEVPPPAAISRGVHAPGLVQRARAALPSRAAGLGAASLSDAVQGALWGALIGDALAAPLHWVYSHGALVALRKEAYGGALRGYSAAPPRPPFAHPDSAAYFARCTPAAEPVDVFRGHGPAWGERGAFYHGALPPGGSTLTGALLGALTAHLAARGGALDAAAWLPAYVATLTGRDPAGAARGDGWTDEAHRVWAHNAVGSGAEPWEAGMEDACLSSIALALPLLLAHAADRDGALLAVRCLLQVTHRSELAVAQAAAFGDLLAALLAPYAPGGAGGRGEDPGFVAAALGAACATLSEGRTSLPEVLARGLSDEDAFHGPRVVFSSR